jgi:hypothetical protein
MPDHDSVMYMLAGLFDDDRGWGVVDETWATMEMLERYGEEAWFRLGDRDFATHIARSSQLRGGRPLTEAVIALQRALGIPSTILPMADEPVRTQLRTDAGWLEFQEYFVHRHQGPEVHEVRFAGVEESRPTDAVLEALAVAELIVIGPSNPIVSLGPILASRPTSCWAGEGPGGWWWRSARSWAALKGPAGCSPPRHRRVQPGSLRSSRRPSTLARRRCGPRARDRRARLQTRHGHDHGRRRGSATPGRGRADVRGPAAGRGRVGTIGGVPHRIRPGAPRTRRSSRSGRSCQDPPRRLARRRGAPRPRDRCWADRAAALAAEFFSDVVVSARIERSATRDRTGRARSARGAAPQRVRARRVPTWWPATLTPS